MKAEVRIRYSIEDVLHQLGQDAIIPQGDEVVVSTLQDKFFKGGGCETSNTGTGDMSSSEPAPRNIAVCMKTGH